MLKPWMRAVTGAAVAYLTRRRGLPVYEAAMECGHVRLVNSAKVRRLLCYTCRAASQDPRPAL